LGFAKIFNGFATDWLQIDSSIIPGLRVRELEASQRNAFGLETTVFTPGQFWDLELRHLLHFIGP